MEITELKNTVTKIKRVTKWKIHGFMIPIWFVFSLWMFPEFPLSTVDLYIDFLFTRLFPIIGTYVVFFLTLYNIPFDPSKKIDALIEAYLKEKKDSYIPQEKIIHIYMDSVAAYYVPNSKENNINVSFYNEDGEYDDFEEVKIKKIIGDKIAIRYKHVPEEIYKLHSNAWDLRQIGTLEINENNYQYLLKNGEIRLQDETNDTIHSVEDTNINISLFWKIYMVLLLILFGTFFYQATFMEEHTELSFRLMFWLLIFAGPLLVIGIHQLLVKKVLKRFMNHWFPAILIHATIITLLGSYLYIEYKKLITDYQLLSNGEAITIEGIVTDIPLKDTLDGEQEQVKNRIVIEGIEYSFTKAPIMEIGKSYRITYLPNTLEIIEFQILKE